MKPNTLRMAAIVSAIGLLGACSHAPIPVADNFQFTTQKKVRSAGHWEILSQDVVQQTLKNLPAASARPALHVTLPDNASDFDRTFREFLITELVNQGQPVTTNSAAGLQVSYKAQLVQHNSPRPNFLPGAVTALTVGAFALDGAIYRFSLGELTMGALGAAALADVGASRYAGGPTHTELVLTTTVASGDRYVSRKTDVYYIEDSDSPLFRAPQPARSLKVVAQ